MEYCIKAMILIHFVTFWFIVLSLLDLLKLYGIKLSNKQKTIALFFVPVEISTLQCLCALLTIIS